MYVVFFLDMTVVKARTKYHQFYKRCLVNETLPDIPEKSIIDIYNVSSFNIKSIIFSSVDFATLAVAKTKFDINVCIL